MKTHRKFAQRNKQQRFATKQALHFRWLRAVAEKELQDHWDHWQKHRIDRKTIEYTLHECLSAFQRKESTGDVAQWASMGNIDTIVSEAYKAKAEQGA